MSSPIKQDDLKEVENEDSDGLSYIEEKDNLKYEGAENGSQFLPIREDEETIGWSSSESEDNCIEDGEDLE